MRILFVGPGNNGKYGGGFYYAFHRRLINGLVRAGHFVFPYSDRDTADYALGVRIVGRHLANSRLRSIARDLRPDLLLLFQSDLVSRETVGAVKRDVPGVKVGVISIDDIGHLRPAAQFRRLLSQADFGFATTGGVVLRSFAHDVPVAFIPNPVDVSIDTEVSFENMRHRFDYFFAGHQPSGDPRWTLIEELQQALSMRGSALCGGVFGKSQSEALSGAAYIRALGEAKVGLNLNRRRGNFYASDRMAQYLGNGLLLASERGSGFEDVFGEDAMLYFDDAEGLADGLERVIGDDLLWRAKAKAGREVSMRSMNETIVAESIVGMLLGERPKDAWAFSQHIFEKGSA